MRRYNIKVGQHEYVIDVQEISADRFRVWLNDRELDVHIAGDQDIAEATITPEMVPVRQDGESIERPRTIYRPPAPDTMPPLPVSQPVAAYSRSLLDLIAPMPGRILTVNVKPGDKVKYGQVLLVLEAMKMKNSLKSPQDGVVESVPAQPGQAVSAGSILVRFAGSEQP